MFYDIFSNLCDTKGVSCKRAAMEMGLSNSIAAKWKRTGATPNGETLSKIAEYFGVSVGYLLGEEDKKETPQDNLERKPNRNVIKIAGRDGSFKERVLTDEQLAALAVLIDQLPDVPDDL